MPKANFYKVELTVKEMETLLKCIDSHVTFHSGSGTMEPYGRLERIKKRLVFRLKDVELAKKVRDNDIMFMGW